MPSPISPLVRVRQLVRKISAKVMANEVAFLVERDRKDPKHGRIFIQCAYVTNCTVSGKSGTWYGRKWYLSDHMLDDEIVKTCYAAFKAAVEHEVMEGFHFDGRRVFNPHTPFDLLITASACDQFRPDPTSNFPVQ